MEGLVTIGLIFCSGILAEHGDGIIPSSYVFSKQEREIYVCGRSFVADCWLRSLGLAQVIGNIGVFHLF